MYNNIKDLERQIAEEKELIHSLTSWKFGYLTDTRAKSLDAAREQLGCLEWLLEKEMET